MDIVDRLHHIVRDARDTYSQTGAGGHRHEDMCRALVASFENHARQEAEEITYVNPDEQYGHVVNRYFVLADFTGGDGFRKYNNMQDYLPFVLEGQSVGPDTRMDAVHFKGCIILMYMVKNYEYDFKN